MSPSQVHGLWAAVLVTISNSNIWILTLQTNIRHWLSWLAEAVSLREENPEALTGLDNARVKWPRISPKLLYSFSFFHILTPKCTSHYTLKSFRGLPSSQKKFVRGTILLPVWPFIVSKTWTWALYNWIFLSSILALIIPSVSMTDVFINSPPLG